MADNVQYIVMGGRVIYSSGEERLARVRLKVKRSGKSNRVRIFNDRAAQLIDLKMDGAPATCTPQLVPGGLFVDLLDDQEHEVTFLVDLDKCNEKFTGSGDIVEIEMSGTMTQIPSMSGCKRLRHVALTSIVNSVPDGCFKDCISLLSVDMPSTVCAIGERAFQGCSSLESINLTPSVESIGAYAFYECKALQSVELSFKLSSIGAYAFWHCEALQRVYLPTSLRSIGSYAFAHCGLDAVLVPPSVASIGDMAFASCPDLVSALWCTNAKVPGGCFSGCGKLEEFITTLGVDPEVATGAFSQTPISNISRGW